MKLLSCVTLLLPLAANGFSLPSGSDMNQAPAVDSQRRNLFAALPAVFLAPAISNALDMDAFVNAEIAKDSKKTDMSPDEAFCKYGQSGEKKTEACKRYRSTGGKVEVKKEKSLGGAYAM
eukprot:CAMPEP_0113649862 /NCGR_PEP_ID=MMETSP0017_2-20120614/26514_1 /TAXON_ID=2856 /ORGANISM="Cylindrotheca closterium" /LENGTH=119 /DNA_ID=CAMNT_0000562301 /DNA_START=30 /DNA_END=389 /DNA_ORIENTATION=+ /assembly_acc=CAM_ASM_000147